MYKKLLLFFFFPFYLFSETIFDLKFTEDAILQGRIKTGKETNPVYVEIYGKDLKIEKYDGLEGLSFQREKKHYCTVLNSNNILKNFSEELNIEFALLYKSTENFDEKNRGGVHSIISQYDILGDKRSFSIYLWEDTKTKKANLNFSISPNGKDVTTFSTPALLEPEKIYKINLIFKIGEFIKIFVNDELKCDKKMEIKEIFKSDTPISIGCRFYGNSPINFFNGVLFNLKISTEEKK